MKPYPEYADMRAVYADTLLELAARDERIVVLEADLMSASGTAAFHAQYPDRMYNCGVAEANMVGVAAGLSSVGFIPFANTFACFASRKVYDQFYISGAYARQQVKLVGTDPGITAQYNGGTHMPFEDVSLMRTIPGMTVTEPCDRVSVHRLTELLAYREGCTYMRLHRKGAVSIHPDDQQFEIGKGILIRDGDDTAIFAYGMVMVPEAIEAADKLLDEGINAAVIDMHTIKPLDEELVIRYARQCGSVVTCDNAQIIGGLGSAVAELLAETYPVPVIRVGVQDEFGEVGTLDYLKKRYGLTADCIVQAVRKAMAARKG